LIYVIDVNTLEVVRRIRFMGYISWNKVEQI